LLKGLVHLTKRRPLRIAGESTAPDGTVTLLGVGDDPIIAIPASPAGSSRTLRCKPARAALSRIRWAICRAGTQVKMWTRMLCPVQSNIGEIETTRGSVSCRKLNSAADWERYPAITSPAGQSS